MGSLHVLCHLSAIAFPLPVLSIIHERIGPRNQLNNKGNTNVTVHVLDQMKIAATKITNPYPNEKPNRLEDSAIVGGFALPLPIPNVDHGKVSLKIASLRKIVLNNKREIKINPKAIKPY